MTHLVLAVDFDNTICYPKWPAIGEPVTTAIETMRQWHTDGHKLVVWTCRAGPELEACRKWLDAHGVPYDTLNENLSERIALYGSDTRKVSADLYIDDRAVGAPDDPMELWALAREKVARLANRPP